MLGLPVTSAGSETHARARARAAARAPTQRLTTWWCPCRRRERRARGLSETGAAESDARPMPPSLSSALEGLRKGTSQIIWGIQQRSGGRESQDKHRDKEQELGAPELLSGRAVGEAGERLGRLYPTCRR